MNGAFDNEICSRAGNAFSLTTKKRGKHCDLGKLGPPLPIPLLQRRRGRSLLVRAMRNQISISLVSEPQFKRFPPQLSPPRGRGSSRMAYTTRSINLTA